MKRIIKKENIIYTGSDAQKIIYYDDINNVMAVSFKLDPTKKWYPFIEVSKGTYEIIKKAAEVSNEELSINEFIKNNYEIKDLILDSFIEGDFSFGKFFSKITNNPKYKVDKERFPYEYIYEN